MNPTIPTFDQFRQQKYGTGAAPAAPTASSFPNLDSSAGGTGGIDPETARKLFGIAALSNPKQTSNLRGAYDLLFPPETAETRNRINALGPALTFIQGVRKLGTKDAGTIKADIVAAKRALPFNIGKKFITSGEQDLVSLDQQLSLLKQNVVRSMQGARMSDMDIKIAESYIPSYQDTPQTITTQLNNLEGFINSLAKRKDTQPESFVRPPLSSFDTSAAE